MTEQEALEVARKQIRAENAAYMREWSKGQTTRLSLNPFLVHT